MPMAHAIRRQPIPLDIRTLGATPGGADVTSYIVAALAMAVDVARLTERRHDIWTIEEIDAFRDNIAVRKK